MIQHLKQKNMWLFYSLGLLQEKLKAEDPFLSRHTMATGFHAFPGGSWFCDLLHRSCCWLIVDCQAAANSVDLLYNDLFTLLIQWPACCLYLITGFQLLAIAVGAPWILQSKNQRPNFEAIPLNWYLVWLVWPKTVFTGQSLRVWKFY